MVDLKNVGSRVSPLLFGHNLEHTRWAVWQGLSAELLANRKFAGEAIADHGESRSNPGPDGVAAHWQSLGGPGVRFSLDGPPLAATPSQPIVVDAAQGGISQTGIPLLQGAEYQVRAWLQVDRPLKVSLQLSDAEAKRPFRKTTNLVQPGSWQTMAMDFRERRQSRLRASVTSTAAPWL